VRYKVFVLGSRSSIPNPVILHLYEKHCQ